MVVLSRGEIRKSMCETTAWIEALSLQEYRWHKPENLTMGLQLVQKLDDSFNCKRNNSRSPLRAANSNGPELADLGVS